MNYIQVFVYGTLKPGEVNYQFYCAKYVVEFFQCQPPEIQNQRYCTLHTGTTFTGKYKQLGLANY